MISFACRQCGRRFDRPDYAGGSLVFCVCGIGNTVPYESTLPPAPPAPEGPSGYPAPFPAPRGPAPAYPGPFPTEPPPVPRPDRCANHIETMRSDSCAACGVGCCADCLVRLDGELLCGPCKNFRVRSRQRVAGTSIWALMSPLLSLLLAAPSLLVVLIGQGSTRGNPLGMVPFLIGAMIPQAGAAICAARALSVIDASPQYDGRGMAFTGLASALLISLGLIEFAILMANLPGPSP